MLALRSGPRVIKYETEPMAFLLRMTQKKPAKLAFQKIGQKEPFLISNNSSCQTGKKYIK
jgi:hypothetical protein